LEEFIKTDELFDVIICNNVLHFTNQGDKLISKIKRLLKPDGIIYLRVENQNFYDLDGFKKEVEENFDYGFIFKPPLSNVRLSLTFINHEI